MWLEVKAGVTIIGCFIFAIIIGLTGNLVFTLLGVMGIGTMIFGDILIGWKLLKTDALCLLDPVGQDQVILDLHLIGGGKRFIKAKKGPKGTWLFVFHKKKAAIINKGHGAYRLPNGNPVIDAHEDYDMSIDPMECVFLEDAFRECKVDDSKKLFFVLKKKEKKVDG